MFCAKVSAFSSLLDIDIPTRVRCPADRRAQEKSQSFDMTTGQRLENSGMGIRYIEGKDLSGLLAQGYKILDIRPPYEVERARDGTPPLRPLRDPHLCAGRNKNSHQSDGDSHSPQQPPVPALQGPIKDAAVIPFLVLEDGTTAFDEIRRFSFEYLGAGMLFHSTSQSFASSCRFVSLSYRTAMAEGW